MKPLKKTMPLANLLLYILIMSWVFSMIDWQVIYLTRFSHPEWKDWMHTHEKQYAAIKGTAELILSTPSIPLKPIFAHAIKMSSTSYEQRKAITHAPDPTWKGFYRPVVRGEPYVYISWLSWFLYWLGPVFFWFWLVQRTLNSVHNH